MAHDDSTPQSQNWLIRRFDQAAIAGLLLFALVALATYWGATGAIRGRQIEIDASDRLSAQFQVDINTADWTELTVLPEIGPALAQRIVQYRAAHGPFAATTDLERVAGIGPKILQRLLPYLRV